MNKKQFYNLLEVLSQEATFCDKFFCFNYDSENLCSVLNNFFTIDFRVKEVKPKESKNIWPLTVWPIFQAQIKAVIYKT
jgi:hypothetical protein